MADTQTKINITINDITTQVPSNVTILEACKMLDIDIPTLCHMEQITSDSSCRICVVDVKNGYKDGLVTSCTEICRDGMTVKTHSSEIKAARRFILDLLLSDHLLDCFACGKNGDCALQRYALEYGIDETSFSFSRSTSPKQKDISNPFYDFDPAKCILCTRCTRTCRERQGSRAIELIERGWRSTISPGFHMSLSDSNCESCGNCVSVCPVGALLPKQKNRFRMWETQKVRTTCPYCGVGCQMDLLVKENRIVGVEPVHGISNEGLLCVKGKFSFDFINHPNRLTDPLIRNADGNLHKATWDEALDLIASKIIKIKQKHGSGAIFGIGSAKITNEDNFLFMKMMRAAIGTNNIDHCARLCHSSTVAGLAATLGSGAMTNPLADVKNTDVIFVTGSNTTEAHPIMGAFIRQAKAAGKKLIVADPVRIPLAEIADIFLQIKPGTSVALSNGLLHVIFKEELENNEYILHNTTGIEDLKESVKKYTPEYTAKICGLSEQDIISAARMYGSAERASIIYSMGITQHINGTDNVISLSNLALATGNIGRPGTGINPLRGQNNVQGACDMGVLPNLFTGYQQVKNPEIRKKFEDAWGVRLSENPGKTMTEAIPGVLEDKIKMLYIVGENPAVSDADSGQTKKALKKAFLVVQDIFLSETAEYADVVLPAASYAEKDGTFVNSERRVQRVHQAVPVKGLPDWEIFMRLMNRLGFKCHYENPVEIFNEMKALTPSYNGMTYKRIEENDGLCWPCPDSGHPGTPVLHVNGPVKGKAELRAVKWKPSPETNMEDYPIVMTTNRLLYHFHTRTLTAKSEEIDNMHPDHFILISTHDAAKLGIADGDAVKVTSLRGMVQTRAVVNDSIKKGVASMPFHWENGANVLTSAGLLDPVSKIPGLKQTGVRIEKA